MIIQTVLKVGRRRLINLHFRMNLVANLDTTKITFVASIKNRVRGQYRATFKYLRESPYIFLILFTAKSTNQVIQFYSIQFCNVSIDYLSVPESVHIVLYLLSYPLNQKSDHILPDLLDIISTRRLITYRWIYFLLFHLLRESFDRKRSLRIYFCSQRINNTHSSIHRPFIPTGGLIAYHRIHLPTLTSCSTRKSLTEKERRVRIERKYT